jgi:hypothetical protein
VLQEILGARFYFESAFLVWGIISIRLPGICTAG